MTVAENLAAIQERIVAACDRSNRNPDEITIIAVTKYVTIERTNEALEAGIDNLGENRTEGFFNKYEAIGNHAKWHFIGTLQSRKVKEIIHEATAIHSLDRKSIAKEIEKRADDVVDCFVQVNVSGEASKHGLQPEETADFIEQLEAYPKVRIVGLMTMAPHVDDEDELRRVFRQLRALRDDVKRRKLPHAPCEGLSMGMSNDFEIAIEEGATHIRIGTQLVGA